MIRIVQFVVGLMALDSRGQQAIDASFADWRHELAHGQSSRLAVHVRSISGVGRALVNAGLSEVPSTWATAFVWKLAAIAALWLIWTLKDGPPGDTYRFFPVTSALQAWTLVAVSLLPRFLMLFPLMVFLAEAIGRRRWRTPVIGSGVLLSVMALFVGLLALPVGWAHLRHETWRYFANASTMEPSVSALLVAVPAAFATVFVTASVWTALLFAHRIRRVGVVGWAICAGIAVPVYLVGELWFFIPFHLRPPLAFGVPPLMLAAIFWATWCLARIEADSDSTIGAGAT